ncbi:hypothetical protein TTHERM_000497499 (macronuclear) [Tetrahymena thermophila SB210]|uniref:Transmembrane protein n=1 Tax=Tetrahymena thermophila (strain SB210) TaxID=312017 RepID=W7WZC1_TETTS|nr:hypothetical protein TTHERM_000497499 [Tetrahymena thermophila SB210]EWS70952.1 hypothetical protein TTHERM_000497499 [Tetrahymena thermophila SB210]|eukprot:XP_012656508.1 hypothetical protein TTHERM_000497499 [Tetrahymena thermophila SB210]
MLHLLSKFLIISYRLFVHSSNSFQNHQKHPCILISLIQMLWQKIFSAKMFCKAYLYKTQLFFQKLILFYSDSNFKRIYQPKHITQFWILNLMTKRSTQRVQRWYLRHLELFVQVPVRILNTYSTQQKYFQLKFLIML